MSSYPRFVIASLFFIVLAFGGGNAKDKGLNRGIKTVHAMILFCLALMGAVHLQMLVNVMKSLDWIISTYYVPVGFLPPWGLVVLTFLSLIAGLIQWVLTCGLAGRQPGARLMFTRLIPIFCLLDCLTVLKVGIVGGSKNGLPRLFWIIVFIVFLIITVFYFLLWWFYSREKTKRLLFGLESSGSNPEQPAPVDVDSQGDGEASCESSSSHDH